MPSVQIVCVCEFPVFGAAFACPVKKLSGFFVQRREAGPEPRAGGEAPEHGEDPPFAGRFPEALRANQAKEEPEISPGIHLPVFGELERTI